MTVPGSRWKKLRLYEVRPFTGFPGEFGPERHLNMQEQLGYKEGTNQTSHALQQMCFPNNGTSDIPTCALSKLIHL
eukprot:4369672-Alexandrium_andersonii.AAC.1